MTVQEQPSTTRTVEHGRETTDNALRIFQLAAAGGGAILFIFGLLAVFRVDFAAGLMDTSAQVAGFGFSAAAAIAALLLGGATMISALANQDRSSTGGAGLLTIVAGITALIAAGRVPEDVVVDRSSVALFIGVGAVVFTLSLIPWWNTRRTTTTVTR